jgi:hypothetical protein
MASLAPGPDRLLGLATAAARLALTAGADLADRPDLADLAEASCWSPAGHYLPRPLHHRQERPDQGQDGTQTTWQYDESVS